ncbi:MAG TPA: response regulator [Chitinophagaceae bacterium]|nr:response regulator [Chitinophagaceae bacterium]
MKQQVLVIDDSKAIRFLLQTILGKKYKVITAADGCSAMQWLSQKNLPDVIIADPQLPDMPNWELMEYITSSGLYGSIPVIALSSLGKEETREKCEELGIENIFFKPFNPVHLERAIENCLSVYEEVDVMSFGRVHLKVG